MDAFTFRTTVNEDQVIRLPAELQLTMGDWEVTIRPVPTAPTKASVTLANQNLRQFQVSLGHPKGIDNKGIDADLIKSIDDSI